MRAAERRTQDETEQRAAWPEEKQVSQEFFWGGFMILLALPLNAFKGRGFMLLLLALDVLHAQTSVCQQFWYQKTFVSLVLFFSCGSIFFLIFSKKT